MSCSGERSEHSAPVGKQSPSALRSLVERLRAAGCVFAEDEAELIVEAAADPLHREELTRRRINGEPLEHLLGWVEFVGRRLAVGPGVFIPRQRTVLLAGAAEQRVLAQRTPVLVEAFCGVAPVTAHVAATAPNTELHGTDIDERALEYALRNVPGARFHLGDGIAAIPSFLAGRVTVLCAVPPYVPVGHERLLPHEARDFEPARTHLGGADGLDHVRRLLRAAPNLLAEDGVALIEMNVGQFDGAARAALADGLRATRIEGNDGQTVLLEASLAPRGS